MELCPKCNEYYKGIQYPTCIQCLPEEKRKAALERIKFETDMRDMHESLGID
jgi:7-cyano-7-deazaguanine synthase in queuosine biosynthesis